MIKDFLTKVRGKLSLHDNLDPGELVFVMIPEPLEPEDRERKYGDPIDAELRLNGMGWVSGGGALCSGPDDDGVTEILWCGVDVEAYDVSETRIFLRDYLVHLGCPQGTELQFDEGGTALMDLYIGELWELARPQLGYDEVNGDT